MPVIVLIVVVAIAAAVWSVRRSSSGSGVPIPTGPPSGAAMEQMRKSAAGGVGAAGRTDNAGGMPGTTSGGTGAPSGQ
jgi:hypothetical protein